VIGVTDHVSHPRIARQGTDGAWALYVIRYPSGCLTNTFQRTLYRVSKLANVSKIIERTLRDKGGRIGHGLVDIVEILPLTE
jgi:hypothetical protein